MFLTNAPLGGQGGWGQGGRLIKAAGGMPGEMPCWVVVNPLPTGRPGTARKKTAFAIPHRPLATRSWRPTFTSRHSTMHLSPRDYTILPVCRRLFVFTSCNSVKRFIFCSFLKFSDFFHRCYHGKMADDDEALQFWLSAMGNNDD